MLETVEIVYVAISFGSNHKMTGLLVILYLTKLACTKFNNSPLQLLGLQRDIPSKRESSPCIDYVPALCPFHLSLLPIEWFVCSSRMGLVFTIKVIHRESDFEDDN